METYAVRADALGETDRNGERILLQVARLLDEHRLRPVLKHELIQAYWLQRGRGDDPRWWREGLAAVTAGSRGAEMVAEAEAVTAIKRGQIFQFRVPLLSWPWTADPDALLDRPMYCGQAALFVAYLRHRQPIAFEHVLQRLQRSEDFYDALEQAYFVQPVTLFEQWRAGVAGR